MWKLLFYGILLAKCQVEVGRLLNCYVSLLLKRNYRPRRLVKAKHTEKINGRYSSNISLEEAFEICRSSFSEEHKT